MSSLLNLVTFMQSSYHMCPPSLPETHSYYQVDVSPILSHNSLTVF